MAKADLIKEAQDLEIPVTEEDTIATLTKKIADKKAEVQTPPPPTSNGLKRVKLTHDQLMKVQAEGRLVDWNSETKEALIKD